MKKIISLWSMTMMLLLGAFVFTACGDDDDDDSSTKTTKDNGTANGGGQQASTIPWGYYATEYETDGQKFYGNLDLLLYYRVRDTKARGDYNALSGYNFIKDYEGYAQGLGCYVFTRNGKTYSVSLWNTVSRSKSDDTYDSRTYDYPGGSVTVYYDIAAIDDDLTEITANSSITYKDGYLIGLNGDHQYKRLNFTKHLAWLDEWAYDLADRLEQN